MTRLIFVMGLALALVSTPAVMAQPAWSDKTEFTFDAPVVVPHATLPAGTYVFKLADSLSNRSVVQIWNGDETQIVTTALSIPMRRTEPTGDVIVKFASTPAGVPPAVKGWFYAGALTGHAFVYPEEQAAKIARTTKTLILSSDVDPANKEQVKSAAIMYVDDRGGSRPLSAQEQQYVSHTPPAVQAAAADRQEGSGRVTLHGLEGEDLAEHHLTHIMRLTEKALNGKGAGDQPSREALVEIRTHAKEAFEALDGSSS
jgi:hypothetical protein